MTKKTQNNPSLRQVHALINRITPDLSALWKPTVQEDPVPVKPTPGCSVIEQLDAVHANIRFALLAAHGGQGAGGYLESLAEAVEDCVSLDPDAALAYLFLRNGNDYPLLHVIHCAVIVRLCGEAAGLDRNGRHPLLCAALSQNISMIALQAELYHLQGPLPTLEQLLIRRHPLTAVGILKALGVAQPQWLEAVALHHEHHDGSGYPFGLQADAIPLGARLISAADVYCAAVSPRGYRPGRPPHEAMRLLFMGANRIVDEDLGRLLIRTLGIYPPGTLVELRSREPALVVERGAQMDQPRVMRLNQPDRPDLITATGEHAPARVLSLELLPAGFNLERAWRKAEGLRQGMAASA